LPFSAPQIYSGKYPGILHIIALTTLFYRDYFNIIIEKIYSIDIFLSLWFYPDADKPHSGLRY